MYSINFIHSNGSAGIKECPEVPKLGSTIELLNNEYIVKAVYPSKLDGVECDVQVSPVQAAKRFAVSLNSNRYS
ncbi:MAG: hypothetical protein CVV11_00810 [Gammaproteobacteria bacterium HGW-Gammaproteobacteria-15]|nr:MAG: hypothetical protein CVV11_00810 [Gammaproteobacteria bacterium HGW-Gammaproteobacteria-15]